MTELINTGIVLRCNSNAEVEQVLFAAIEVDSNLILQKPFASLAQPGDVGPVLHFIEALKQFGSAEGWRLNLVFDGQQYQMVFSGVTMVPDFILVGYKFEETSGVSAGRKSLSKDIGTNSQISLEDEKTFTAEMDETELLDELSRLNNELVNNKRDLIRKQSDLHRKKKK